MLKLSGSRTLEETFAVLRLTESYPRINAQNKAGLDIVSIAKGYGCDAARLDDLEEIKKAAVEAWSKSKPTVLRYLAKYPL